MDVRKSIRCCGGTDGAQARSVTRKSLLEYRSWSWIKFMSNTQGSVFCELWSWLVFFAVMNSAVVVIHHWVTELSISKDYHAFLLFPISFLLVFRSNTAYARFWEGRGHFETFNFALRELSRRTTTFIRDYDVDPQLGYDRKSDALRRNMLRMLMALAIATRQNLRKRTGGDIAHREGLAAVKPYLTEDELEEWNDQVKNRPLLVMSWLGKYISEAEYEKKLQGGEVMMAFDNNISLALRGWMGMNKVCFQPLPFPYLHMLHWAILLWSISLPCRLVGPYGWCTCIVSPIIVLALYAIEETSQEIEDPFGDDLNDLPTENFELGLKRDARLVMSGGARELGRPGQHFGVSKPMTVQGDVEESTLRFGLDFSIPLDDIEENEMKPKPIHHEFGNQNCRCKSCISGGVPASRRKKRIMIKRNHTDDY